jgi:hypothetical protein
MNSLRGRIKTNGIRFCQIIRIEFQQTRTVTYKRRIEVCQSIAGGSLEHLSFAQLNEMWYSYLKDVDRIHEEILLPAHNYQSHVLVGASRLTNFACAITFEKLSLKILIKDVINRMLVMVTKISFHKSVNTNFDGQRNFTISGGPSLGLILKVSEILIHQARGIIHRSLYPASKVSFINSEQKINTYESQIT